MMQLAWASSASSLIQVSEPSLSVPLEFLRLEFLINLLYSQHLG